MLTQSHTSVLPVTLVMRVSLIYHLTSGQGSAMRLTTSSKGGLSCSMRGKSRQSTALSENLADKVGATRNIIIEESDNDNFTCTHLDLALILSLAVMQMTRCNIPSSRDIEAYPPNFV